MNWGIKITLTYSLFVLGMLFLVYKASQENIDLVTDKYYEKAIHYEDRYNSMMAAQDSTGKLIVNYEAAQAKVAISYPATATLSALSGEVHFFRPDDAQLDFAVAVKPDANHLQHISTAKLKRGLWRIQSSWKAGDKSYYQEDKVFIQ